MRCCDCGCGGLALDLGLGSPDSKTVRRYVEAAQAAGLTRDAGEAALTDELIGAVVETVRPSRRAGTVRRGNRCEDERDRIAKWLDKELTVVKVHDLLARRGVVMPERTLHRFCAEELGYRKQKTTVRVNDGAPRRSGSEPLTGHRAREGLPSSRRPHLNVPSPIRRESLTAAP